MNKQKIVYDFLLTPISGIKTLNCKENVIKTTQKYYSKFDPDMSDIAIEFYKIIYDIDEIIDERNGHLLFGKQFAGDTMCSFNTIAKKMNKSVLTEKQQAVLDEYYNFYHCLANFWILPMWIGRSYPRMPHEHRWASKSKNGINDYMDSFLLFLKNGNYSKFVKQYKQYGMKFDTFDNFCTKHFLVGQECFIRNGEVCKYSLEGNPEDVIARMTDLIKARAEIISKDDKVCDKLYSLWEKQNKTSDL